MSPTLKLPGPGHSTLPVGMSPVSGNGGGSTYGGGATLGFGVSLYINKSSGV